MKYSLQNTEFPLVATGQLYYFCDPHLGYLSNSRFDSLNYQKNSFYRRMIFNIYLREEKRDAEKHAKFRLLQKQTWNLCKWPPPQTLQGLSLLPT
jgi:hypothetical protein